MIYKNKGRLFNYSFSDLTINPKHKSLDPLSFSSKIDKIQIIGIANNLASNPNIVDEYILLTYLVRLNSWAMNEYQDPLWSKSKILKPFRGKYARTIYYSHRNGMEQNALES